MTTGNNKVTFQCTLLDGTQDYITVEGQRPLDLAEDKWIMLLGIQAAREMAEKAGKPNQVAVLRPIN